MRTLLILILLICFSVANAQEIRVIDNKGTIKKLVIPSVVERYPNADQTVEEAATFTTLNFQSQDFAPEATDYKTDDDDGITILNAGRYKVTCRITSEVMHNNRAGGEFHLIKNGNLIANTKAYNYQRNNLVDKATVTIVKILDLVTNDKIGVEGRVYASSRGADDELRILAEGTTLTIEKAE